MDVSPGWVRLLAATTVAGVLLVLTAVSFGAEGDLTFLEREPGSSLGGAFAVAASPDGRHVYVASTNEDSLTAFRREADGSLTFVEVERDGVGGVDGLDGARAVAVSPDGKHVYVASDVDNSLAAFASDPNDNTAGHLDFVEFEDDGVGGVDGLAGVAGVAVSPDGKHVYTGSYNDDSLTAFARDANDNTAGHLDFVDFEDDGVGGVDGLSDAVGVTVSPDGKHVYVAGYGDKALAAFARDDADNTAGHLDFVEAEKDGVGGVNGLDAAYAVAVSPDGKHVYVASQTDDSLAAFARDANDNTAGHLDFVEFEDDGVGGVDGLDGATGVTVSPDGKHVYVTGQIDDSLAVFARDGNDNTAGHLDFVEFEDDGVAGVDGLNSARAVVVSPDGNDVYVASEADSSLAAFSRDDVTGGIDFEERLPGSSLDGAFAVAASPDGMHVYVASQTEDSLTTFRRKSDGSLIFLEVERDGLAGVDGLDGARAVAVSPDGKHVYVVSGTDNSLVVFARDANDNTDGHLDFVEFEDDGVGGVDGLGGAAGVTVSPDGKHVYVASFVDASLAAFASDPNDNTAGHLDFVEFEKDGVGGVNGLDGARGVAVSPDGKHVYVASEIDDSLAAFARDANDNTAGHLDFAEFEDDGVAGVDGLDGAKGVAVSPDGKHVYVASEIDDSLAAFARDANDNTAGHLDFAEFEDDGVGGVNGLDGANGVAVSPDGKHVYVAANLDDSLAAFARDANDNTAGHLDFVEFEDDGVGGVDGLDGASGVAVSPDGGNVYVTSQVDDAVAAFARELDMTPPDTQIDSGPGALSTDRTPTFTFSSDDPSFTTGFECKIDEGPYEACLGPGDTHTTSALADGPHSFRVRATDTAGNTDPAPALSTFTVDATPPDTELTTEPASTLTTRKKKATAVFEFEASEPGTFVCRVDAAAFTACTTPHTEKLPKGNHVFRVRAVDTAGNTDFSSAKWVGKVVVKK